MKNTDIDHFITPDNQDALSEKFDIIQKLIDEHDFEQVKNTLSNLHYADLADFLDISNEKTTKQVISIFEENLKPDTLVWVNPNTKKTALDCLGTKQFALLVSKLDSEDAIEVIEDFDDFIREQILSHLPPKKRVQISEGFTYKEHTAGRIMGRNFITFDENTNVGKAIEYIKSHKISFEFHAAFVVDKKFKPIGYVTLSNLVKHKDDVPIKYLLNNDMKIASTSTDLEDLSYIFKQYALNIVPVVNKTGRIIGSISIDNMLYIIDEQNQEELMHLGGLYKQDTFNSLLITVKHRFPWLFINLLTAYLTSLIVHQFSDTISKMITIAAMMPIVAAIGGNAATQVTTVTVRALANKDIIDSNALKVIAKELIVSMIIGISISLIAGCLAFYIYSETNLSTIFMLAIVINFIVAGFFGAVIPILFHNLKIDPAIASGVFVTTLTDSLGFLSFLFLAYLMI